MNSVELRNKEQSARVKAGELVSFQKAGYEFMHRAGEPGWSRSEIEMFPIIGPTDQAGFRVQVNKGNALQDQHGLLREMDYNLSTHSEAEATFVKTYVQNTVIENSKYPERSSQARLIWPYNFEITKTIRLSPEELIVKFSVDGDRDMPFMLGYHPAFKIHSKEPIIRVADKTITIDEVKAVGSQAMLIENCNEIVLEDQQHLRLQSTGFKHFMLWTEVSEMVCIEPISFYPYAVAQQNLHEGFQYLGDQPESFSLTMCPL